METSVTLIECFQFSIGTPDPSTRVAACLGPSAKAIFHLCGGAGGPDMTRGGVSLEHACSPSNVSPGLV